ncbi:MAG: thioredoxin family protein, partial [Chitinophagia bacterium]|nr:thioredoxin family protein [Chitinophagia bacterium]
MKLFSLTTVSLLFSLFLVAQVPPSLKIGAAIPTYNVAMQNATGNDAVTLQSAMGKNGLLVMFSCNTCPFVLKNQQLTKKTIYHANANNIGMIIVNSNEAKRDGDDSYKDMKKYASAQGYTVPYV